MQLNHLHLLVYFFLNHYLYQETLKEFLHTAYELGKYKEVVKLLKNSYTNN